MNEKDFYEIARGSIVEIDAALDILHDLNYLKNYDEKNLGEYIIKTFKILTALVNSHRN